MLTDVVVANKSYTRLNIPEDQEVDYISLMVMKQDCPDFLLPIKVIEIDGELELRYELLEGIRLSYSSLKMNKKEFAVLLKNMLTPFKICGDWFLDSHNILMDANYILVSKGGQTVRYIYLPVPEYAQSDAELMDFFWNIILKAEIEDDPRYAMNLLRVLKSDNANLMTLLDYVSKEEQGAAGQQPDHMPEDMAQEVPAREPRPFRPAAPAASAVPPAVAAPKPFQPIPNSQAAPKASQPMANPQAAPEEAKKPLGETGYRGSGGAARPGQMPKEFGKQDVEGQLVGNLFGEDEEDEPVKRGKNEKGNKEPKTPKEPKGSKEPKPPKEKKESGLFDLFKGKKKNDSLKPSMTASGGQEAAFTGAAAALPLAAAESAPGGWQGSSGYGEDATEIAVDEEVSDNNLLRLSLEDGAGFHCPKYIEIDLSKGFATVGRFDKSGNGQADFNFDASLSFISRRHFRVEKAGDEWCIIDLESKNGTFVNGSALIPNMAHPLRSGDRIMISSKNRLMYRVL